MIDNYTFVVGVTGKMMSGKDTASEHLDNQLNSLDYRCSVYQLSNYMKTIVKMLWGADTWSTEGKTAMIAPNLTGREALQKISSFFRGLDEKVWLRALEQDIRGSHLEIAIISDIRLPFEAEFCDFVIRVDRPGGPASTKDEQNHETETGVEDINPDRVVLNDGTVADLYNAVQSVRGEIEKRLS